MAGKQGNNRIVWEDWQLEFLRDNWDKMTNSELSMAVGISHTSVRYKVYMMGFKKMEIIYWTDEQIEALKHLYKTLGDTEIAEIFNRRWKKKGGWSKKHIEKKRLYLKLKRTKEEIAYIKRRNVEKGRYAMANRNRWKDRTAKNKEIRIWEQPDGAPRAYIKINGRFRDYARWCYQREVGAIPRGMLVRTIDGNPLNITISNLRLVTRREHGLMNKTQPLEYKRERVKSIINFKIKQNEEQINRLK